MSFQNDVKIHMYKCKTRIQWNQYEIRSSYHHYYCSINSLLSPTSPSLFNECFLRPKFTVFRENPCCSFRLFYFVCKSKRPKLSLNTWRLFQKTLPSWLRVDSSAEINLFLRNEFPKIGKSCAANFPHRTRYF